MITIDGMALWQYSGNWDCRGEASGGLGVFKGSGGVGNLASRLDEGCDANFLRVERVIGRRRRDEVTKTR